MRTREAAAKWATKISKVTADALQNGGDENSRVQTARARLMLLWSVLLALKLDPGP